MEPLRHYHHQQVPYHQNLLISITQKFIQSKWPNYKLLLKFQSKWSLFEKINE